MTDQRIIIDGLFEHVSLALSTLPWVTVEETSERHTLVVLASGGTAVARPRPGGGAVSITLTDAGAGEAAVRLAASLRELLDYEISDPVPMPAAPSARPAAQASLRAT